jgi:hypothetical protein
MNFMENRRVWVLAFLLIISFAFVLAEEAGDGADSQIDSDIQADTSSSGGSGLTVNFYFALGFGVLGLLVIAYLVYSFLRKYPDRWRKK